MSTGVILHDDLKALLRSRRSAQERAEQQADRARREALAREAFVRMAGDIVLPRSGQRPLVFRGIHLVTLTGRLKVDGQPVHRLSLHERDGGGFVVGLTVAPGKERANAHHLAADVVSADDVRSLLTTVAADAGLCLDFNETALGDLEGWAIELRTAVSTRRDDLTELVTHAFTPEADVPAFRFH